MATATTFSPFAAAKDDVRAYPTLACLGYIGSVSEAALTRSEVYGMSKIKIEPTQGGKVGYVNFLFRPEWLRPGFDPRSIKAEPGGDKMFAVYRMHIAAESGVSTLAGLAGSEENFYQLAGQIQQAIEGVDDAEAIAVVGTVIKEFLSENSPEVGYILKQKREETGEFNESGNKVKALVNGYEVGGFFYNNESNQQRLAKQAAAGKITLAFEV